MTAVRGMTDMGRAQSMVYDAKGNLVPLPPKIKVSERALRAVRGTGNILTRVQLMDSDYVFGWLVADAPETALKIQEEIWEYCTKSDVKYAPQEITHESPENHIRVRELVLVKRPKWLHEEIQILENQKAMGLLDAEYNDVRAKLEEITGGQIEFEEPDISEEVAYSKEELAEVARGYRKWKQPSGKSYFIMNREGKKVEDVFA